MNLKKLKKAELIELIEKEYVPIEQYNTVVENYKLSDQKLLDFAKSKEAMKIKPYDNIRKDNERLSAEIDIEKAKQKSLELCFSVLIDKMIAKEVKISKEELKKAMMKKIIVRLTDDGYIIKLKEAQVN